MKFVAVFIIFAAFNLLNASTKEIENYNSYYNNNPLININGIELNVLKKNYDVPMNYKNPSNKNSKGYYLIKFKNAIEKTWIKDLKDLGIKFYDYIPINTFIIKANSQMIPLIQRKEYVWRIEDYHPYYKLAPEIRELIQKPEDIKKYAKDKKIVIIVDFFENEELEGFQKNLIYLKDFNVAQVENNYSIKRAWIKIKEDNFLEAIKYIAHYPGVATLELLKEIIPMNDAARWVHQNFQQNIYPLYDHNLKGQNQIGAITDTGFDYDMCYFWDPLLGSPPVDAQAPFGDVPENLSMRKVIIYYAMDGNPCGSVGTPGGISDHGTHTAGSIAGDNYLNPEQQDPGDGMALSAKLVLEDPGDSFQYYNNACGSTYDFYDISYNDGARIHSNSWGLGCSTSCPCKANVYDSLARDADNFAWQHKDMTIFFAAGNSAAYCPDSTVISPSIAKNVISVGASYHDLQAEYVASFSSHGLTYDHRLKPTLIAQGVSTSSADNDSSLSSFNCSTRLWSGTSMATPTAAGFALLARQYFTDGYYPSGTPQASDSFEPSSALIRALLINSSVNMTGVSEDIPNKIEGWGRLKLDDSLYFPGDERKLFVKDENIGLDTNWNRCYTIPIINNLQPLKITLAWTDYPAFLNSNPALVNDLMLEVISPSNIKYHQSLNSDYLPIITTNELLPQDNRNTEEQIIINNPEIGNWTIKVSGINVPIELQPYAVAATGSLGNPIDFKPTGLTAINTANNQITLSWAPVSGASCYDVYRSFGNCANSNVSKIANCIADTSFIDNEVSGGSLYSYRISAVFSNGCSYELSDCVEITATGICTLPPIFDGIKTVKNNASNPCSITLQWNNAISQCPSFPNITYSIFRDLNYDFIPSSKNLLASCVSGNSYTDYDIPSGINFYYIVRAEDSRPGGGSGFCNAGNTDQNLIRKKVYATGTETVLFADDAGDNYPLQMILGDNWSIANSKNHTPNGTFSYSSGSANLQCSSLSSPNINLTGKMYYDLSYFVQYQIEEGRDGAIVQISSDNGSNWQTIEPEEGYPSVLINYSGSCIPPTTKVYSGYLNEWNYQHYDLTNLSDTSILLRFLYGSDAGYNLSGLFIDDIKVSGYGECVNQFGFNPREASPPSSPMLCHKSTGNKITCSYSNGGSCTTGNTIYYGKLSDVSSYTFTGANCNIGTSGIATFNPGQGDSYWIIVSNNGTYEGSAGKDSFGKERPDPPAFGKCNFPQATFNIC